MTLRPPPQPIFYRDGDVDARRAGKIVEQRQRRARSGSPASTITTSSSRAGASRAGAVRVEYQPLDVPVETTAAGAQYVTWSARYPPSAVQAPRIFAGPKDFDVLAAVDRDLVRAIDFGMFAWLVVPLLRALKWINGYVGNYGWSIILADRPHQPRDVPAAPQERRVDAEDAGRAAAR